MKKITFLLAMLPVAAFAQNTKVDTATKLKSTVVHYEKLVINYKNQTLNGKPATTRTTMDSPGDLNFRTYVNKNNPDKTEMLQKHPNYDFGIMTAENVQISSPAFPILKGDKLVYDNLTDKAVISGHITITDNGAEKYLGEVAYLDFNADETYTITGLK